MLQRIEAGDAYRPADLERRAAGHRRPAARGPVPCRRADRALGARRDGVASLAMAHVQTVLGPIEPDALGFTLPHEHTQIALWHIESRWDYWQLTRDEPVILAELAQFRAAGGSGLVDLTLPGVGRDPAWLVGLADGERPAHRHGLRLVSDRLLPARGPDRPALDRRPRRRAGPRGDRRGGGDGRPARDHRRDRDRQAVGLAVRGARPSGGCPGVAADRAGHHDPRACCPMSGSPSSGSSRRRAPTRRGSSSATPTRTRSSTTTWRSSSAGRTSSSTSSGCRGNANERHGETRVVELLCELLGRGHARSVCSSARTSATTRSSRRFGGNGYTYLTDTFLPRLRAAGVSEDEITTMTVANPRRLLTIG